MTTAAPMTDDEKLEAVTDFDTWCPNCGTRFWYVSVAEDRWCCHRCNTDHHGQPAHIMEWREELESEGLYACPDLPTP